jgi:hypothetical protein
MIINVSITRYLFFGFGGDFSRIAVDQKIPKEV